MRQGLIKLILLADHKGSKNSSRTGNLRSSVLLGALMGFYSKRTVKIISCQIGHLRTTIVNNIGNVSTQYLVSSIISLKVIQ